MRRVEPCGGLEALAFAAGVARFGDGAIGNRHLHLDHGVMAERDERRSTGAHVIAQFVLKAAGQNADVRQNHKGILRRVDVGSLLDHHGLDIEGGLSAGFERRFEVEQRLLVAGLINEERGLGVGALDGEVEGVVGGQLIGGIDLHDALVAAIGHFERVEFDGGAAGFGHVRRFCFHYAVVEDERHLARRFGVAEAGDSDEHALLACRRRRGAGR